MWYAQQHMSIISSGSNSQYVLVIVLYLNLQCSLLGLNEANHNHNLSSPVRDDVDPYGTPLLVLGGASNINDNEDDGDDGDLAGPTVDMHVDLAKIACKYFIYLLLDTTVIHYITFTVRKVYPEDIATEIKQPNFTNLIQQFIYNQEHTDGNSDSSLAAPPIFYRKITVYPSAIAMFHAPSDISDIGGMHHEHIHAVKSWRNSTMIPSLSILIPP